MTAVFFLTLAGAAIYLAAGGRWARFGELGRIMFILGLAALLFARPLRLPVLFGGVLQVRPLPAGGAGVGFCSAATPET